MPYKLVAKMKQGHSITVLESHNPQDCIDGESRIAHDPRTVQRIEVRDLTGVLRTLWDADWQAVYDSTADHTTKACIEAHVEKLGK